MRAGAVLFGVVGALAGAAIWGFLAWQIGIELGFLAWGIGAFIGALVTKAGGGGTGMAVMAGALSVLSMAGGKMLAVGLSYPGALRAEYIQGQLNETEFKNDVQEAADLKDLKTDDEFRNHLIAYRWVDTTDPARVTKEEVDQFKNQHRLQVLAEGAPSLTYTSWQDLKKPTVNAEATDFVNKHPATMGALIEVTKADLGAFDLLFAVLGVSTAFGMVKAADEPKPAA